MKFVFLISLFAVVFGSGLYAQIPFSCNWDTLNKYDENKKRTGYWIENLNLSKVSVKDQQDTAFYRLAFYVKGLRIWPATPENYYKKLFIPVEESIQGMGISLMDGTYKLCRKDTLLIIEEDTYSAGRVLFEKTWHPNGNVKERVDYTRKYANGSFKNVIIDYPEFSYLLLGYFSDGRIQDSMYVGYCDGEISYICPKLPKK